MDCLLKGQAAQEFGKYGWSCEKVAFSMPGFEVSPGCGSEGWLYCAAVGTFVGSSSVDVRVHLQFHRSPGRCWIQKG